MTYFIRNGSQYRTTNEANINISKNLPVGTYSVMADLQGFYLETIQPMRIEGKIYGDAGKRAERIINTFDDRPLSTGIILEGDKGSGKTFLAKILSMKLMEVGVPTLIVNTQFAGEPFNAFIQSIDQPAMIFFDEFEKVYDQAHQSKLLTLLDGSYSTKKMFVVALNETHRLVDFFKNRPGRFYYRFEYKGLDEQFVREYCEDCLNNKKQIDKVVLFSSAFSSFNFDILKALVEEMNRYDEGVMEVSKYINASPVVSLARYSVESLELKPNPRAKKERVMETYDKQLSGGAFCAPMKDEVYLTWYNKDKYDYHISFYPRDIDKIENGKFYYENDEAKAVIGKHIPTKSRDLLETLLAE